MPPWRKRHTPAPDGVEPDVGVSWTQPTLTICGLPSVVKTKAPLAGILYGNEAPAAPPVVGRTTNAEPSSANVRNVPASVLAEVFSRMMAVMYPPPSASWGKYNGVDTNC